MDNQKHKMIAMSPSEMALYQSGRRRGHAECLKQIAEQLREAAGAREKMIGFDENGDMTAESKVHEATRYAYEAFAAQLDGPAKEAAKEQHALLDKYLEAKAAERTLLTKLKGAINGAIGGWKG